MYLFSLVRNNGRLFPELLAGDVVVFGDHPRAFAKCDCDGNMNRPYPGNKPFNNMWLPLGKDRDSIYAWHGERKRDGYTEMVKLDWSGAVKRREKEQQRREREKQRRENKREWEQRRR